MTIVSPCTGLRHILDLIDQDAPYHELRAAADKLSNLLATPVFDLLHSHRDHDLRGVEVFDLREPDKRLWVVVEVRGNSAHIVTTVDEDWQSRAWFKAADSPLRIRPNGTRLTLPTVAPPAPEPRTAPDADAEFQQVDALIAEARQRPAPEVFK